MLKRHPGNLSIPDIRGERERFHKLFVAYREAVFKMAHAILRNREEAMDVVQDTFLKAMEKGESFQKSPSVKGWLLKVARNLSIDRYRRRRAVPLEEGNSLLQARGSDRMSRAEEMDMKGVIREIFPQLPPREQEVFALRYYEDMTLREISAEIGVAEGTVKTLHHRVLTRIRVLVADKWGRK